jgi:hypothetical protein
MELKLKKATRKQVKLRLGLSGASGFGKTYSGLLLAHGMTNDWSKIAVIDTENESASLYAHLGEYNTMSIAAPFTPEKYIEAIKACEDAGMEVIIIDSITHEWDGKGGILDIQNALGGKYQDWAKVTPRHQAFIDAILQSKAHTITTVRRKQDYEMSKDSSGKLKVEKVGTKEVTREGFEYELTINFEFLNDKHLVKASKDRTGLFMDKPEFIITEEIGREILRWCETGEDPNKYKNDLLKEYAQLLSNDEVFTADEQKQLACKSNWAEDRLERGIKFLKEKIESKLVS